MADDYHQLRDAAPPAPMGCPVNHEWSPLNEDYLADPYPIASALRDDCPLFYAEQLGYVVITEMADILDVFNQPDVYSSEIVQDPVFPLGAGEGGPRRTRLRPAEGDVESPGPRPRSHPQVHTPRFLAAAAPDARAVRAPPFG